MIGEARIGAHRAMEAEGTKMRLLLRLASFLALAVAVLAGTVDAIQSVAASQPAMTSLADAISALGPDALNWVHGLQRTDAGPAIWLAALQWLLARPAFAVFLALALLLWMAGYKKRPAAGRFAA